MRGIFHRELTCQPGLAPIVPVERGLQTGQAWRGEVEALGGVTQLQRMRPVLGIMHGNDLAAAKAQGIVERARLGARVSGRCDDDTEAGVEVAPLYGGERLGVVRFQNQTYFQLAGRIVDRPERLDELGDDRSFAIEGHDDAGFWQGALGQGATWCMAGPGQRAGHAQQGQRQTGRRKYRQ